MESYVFKYFVKKTVTKLSKIESIIKTYRSQKSKVAETGGFGGAEPPRVGRAMRCLFKLQNPTIVSSRDGLPGIEGLFLLAKKSQIQPQDVLSIRFVSGRPPVLGRVVMQGA